MIPQTGADYKKAAGFSVGKEIPVDAKCHVFIHIIVKTILRKQTEKS